jgi:hypothetical protein
VTVVLTPPGCDDRVMEAQQGGESVGMAGLRTAGMVTMTWDRDSELVGGGCDVVVVWLRLVGVPVEDSRTVLMTIIADVGSLRLLDLGWACVMGSCSARAFMRLMLVGCRTKPYTTWSADRLEISV